MADGAKVTWRGAQAKAAVHRGLERGLLRAAQLVGDESQKVVPRESDDLADSMVVSGEPLAAAVSYDTAYAVKQHESLRLRHARGKTAKYLERPLLAGARSGAVAQAIATEINRETQ